MKPELLQALEKAASTLKIEAGSVALDFPESLEHGDFTSNVAMVNAKKLGLKPRDLAEKIVAEFEKNKPAMVESVSIAGPGFINFKIKDSVFAQEIIDISKQTDSYGKLDLDAGKKMMVEYTDPNPFKIFHIGHLMSNAIGEAISRLLENSGAKIIRACYQGDVGLHVAKTIWAIMKDDKGIAAQESKSITEQVKYLGDMYVKGSQFDEDTAVQKEIAAINKKIYDKSDADINLIYEKGRRWSLDYFDLIYKRLGTKFDKFFFESEVAGPGAKIVREFLDKKDGAIFKESEGAVIFPGEDYGLHTRVFINSQGLPTYEAKDLGLNTEKFKLYPDLMESLIVTANEVNDYFKVVLKALSMIVPAVVEKTRHISHGMLRFASGKMSSHKGNIVSAEDLITEIKGLVIKKIADRKFSREEADEIADSVAVAAIKYTILRQAIGGDVIFDSSASISFEGDSGPYLQYATVRANSILEKAKQGSVDAGKMILPEKVGSLEKLVTRFPDIVGRARLEYAPQYVANYLIHLASTFNSFYASQVIIDEKNPLSQYYVALTQAFVATMTNGLWLLGIMVPKRM